MDEDRLKRIEESLSQISEVINSGSSDIPLLQPVFRKQREESAKIRDIFRQERTLQHFLANNLSPGEWKIIMYLWDRGSAGIDDIFRDVWDKTIQPDSQRKTIERLQQRFYELNCKVYIETKNKIVTLIRPDE